MPDRRAASLLWIGSALALMLVFGGCTKGGQFDPTDLLSSDVLSGKKKLAGDREPLFPNGVPGAETGVPADLMKGYQPPPEQAADNAPAAQAPNTQAKPAATPTAAKPKPKPKPAVARAPSTPSRPGAPPPSSPHDPIWDRTPVPTASQAPPPAWPNQAPQSQAQTNWPAPPPSGQGQMTAQPAQPNWPNPSAQGSGQGTYSR